MADSVGGRVRGNVRNLGDLPWAVMQAALAAADDAILICEAEPLGPDPHPRVVYVNDGYTRMTGYSAADALGRSPRLTQGPDTDRAALDRIRTALQGWQPVREEVLNYRKDGTAFWVELNIRPVADDSGWFTHWVSVQRDISARKAAEFAIQRAADFDDLTGLPKLARVRQEATRLGRDGLAFVAVVDVDHLRFTNDALGMRFGDVMLCHAGGLLAKLAEGRPILAGRVGGDSFVAVGVLESRAAIDAWCDALAGQLRGGLVHHDIMLDTSATIGLAVADPATAEFDELLRCADIATAEAKRLRPGGWMLFDETMRQQVAERDAQVTRARQALAAGTIVPWFQPIMRPSTGEIVGHEALLRIVDDSGCHGPQSITAARNHPELARRIGEVMLRQVLTQLAAWRAAGVPMGYVALNVAPPDLLRPGYAAQLLAALAGAGVPPACLRLEVTEHVVMGPGAGQVGAILTALAKAGVGIVLDDFGTGYASLVHLKSLPIRAIKIDRSFVSDMTSSALDASIVRGIVSMANALDLEVVAEGVETQAQLRLLKRFGCDLVQGYLYGRPVPGEHIVPMARRTG